MHVYALLDVDLWGQLRGESIHFALVVVLGGIAYFIKRDLRLWDERLEKIEVCHERHADQLASHSRQIRDTRAAVGCCETAIDIQHYPYTD